MFCIFAETERNAKHKQCMNKSEWMQLSKAFMETDRGEEEEVKPERIMEQAVLVYHHDTVTCFSLNIICLYV